MNRADARGADGGLPCGCYTCDQKRREQYPEGDIRRIMRHMPLCDTCGYKRCPRATHHDNECTCSNEGGQHGSVYA